jgi:hypothetical protein
MGGASISLTLLFIAKETEVEDLSLSPEGHAAFAL